MSPSKFVSSTLLLLTPFTPSLFSNDSCLSSAFFGNVQDGGRTLSIFRPDALCLTEWASQTTVSSALMAEASSEVQQLVWLSEQAVDASLKSQTRSFRNEFDAFLDTLSRQSQGDSSPAEEVIAQSQKQPKYELLYRTTSAALLSVSSEQANVIDTLPRFWKSRLLPISPISYIPVSPSATKRVEEVLSTLRFDPVVASIADGLSIRQMRKDIRFLTGEDGESGIVSRHSFSEGALVAASWLKDRFEETGATCKLQPFLRGFAPNVICKYSALTSTTNTVLLSGHYDSRGSFGMTRAPGGDDDGSGIVSLLSIARAISKNGIQFHSNVELVAFAGEEQGLLGSRAYAKELRAANADLSLMVQADMLAYRKPGEPLQLGIPDAIGSPLVIQLISNVSAIYSPELHVGSTPVCCSDHEPFHEQGFPAAQLFERAGPIADPMYHNSGDLSDRVGYDFEQLKFIAKAQLATLLHTAGYELVPK